MEKSNILSKCYIHTEKEKKEKEKEVKKLVTYLKGEKSMDKIKKIDMLSGFTKLTKYLVYRIEDWMGNIRDCFEILYIDLSDKIQDLGETAHEFLFPKPINFTERQIRTLSYIVRSMRK